MSLIRRLFGAGGEARPSTVILYDSAQSDSPPRSSPPSSASHPSEEEPSQRRRRGGRGGRGRGRGEPSADSRGNGNGAAAPAQRPAGRSDGRSDSRSEGRSQAPRNGRWRRPALSSLDAPLPEDIAFRPAAEGGDASIVPARRRPVGPKTDRVLYAGIKQYVTRSAESESESESEAVEAEAPPAPPPAVAVEVSSDVDEEATPKRRRRGRRGGRRHRHAEGGEAGASSEADDEPEDSDESDDDEDALDEDEDEKGGDVAPRDEQRPQPSAPSIEVDPASYPPAFRALGLHDRSLAAVTNSGFTTPSPIQEQAIPLLLGGRDVVGIAQTGTGKTLAFGLPMVERLDAGHRAVQGLVLVPTRELAQQVLEVLQDLGRYYGLDAVGLLGGRSLDRDFRALERQPHIVVGTPGRVIDHLHRQTLSLSAVRYAVLDEADQMLDIGFLPDITRILTRTPRARQTALFSATMPHSILRLVRRYMEEPETVTIAPEQTTVETVEQVYFEVAQRDKIRGLRELIERELRGRTLVFSRTRRGVDYLRDQLSDAGIRVGALHGDMDQRKRDQVVQQFRSGQLDVLVATNVAARGLDIPEITHVLNYDVPQNPEEYVHRIGRTGRAGRSGKAITFVCERDVAEFDTLLAAFGERLQKEHLELYERPVAGRD